MYHSTVVSQAHQFIMLLNLITPHMAPAPSPSLTLLYAAYPVMRGPYHSVYHSFYHSVSHSVYRSVSRHWQPHHLVNPRPERSNVRSATIHLSLPPPQLQLPRHYDDRSTSIHRHWQSDATGMTSAVVRRRVTAMASAVAKHYYLHEYFFCSPFHAFIYL